MNIKQIRYFAAVVEHGSLSAAAKSQRITVQAVSKTIADLEREMGCDLFARNNQGMRPTPFALTFYERVRGVLNRFDELERFAQNHARLGERLDALRLALNTPAFPGNEMVRENTAALVQAQVGIPTTMDLATGERGFEGLRTGAYDVLVTVGMFDRPDVECHPVGTVPSAVMMAPNHPLASRSAVSLEDLAPYAVARSSWFHGANAGIASKYRERGADLRFVDLALSDVEAHFRDGGVILTTGIPAMGRASSLIALRPFTPEDTVTVPICAVFLKERGSAIKATLQELLASGVSFFGL